jgi:hypothetical protein
MKTLLDLLGAIILALAAAALGLALSTTFASAAECAQRDQLVAQLDERWGEARLGLGIANGKVVAEIWANEETGSWSFVGTMPDGTSCLIATGTAWERDNARAAAPGAEG